MILRFFYRSVITILALLCFDIANGQFYNGLQMSFGKNRVHYYDYYWSFYRFDDIDCYFNENGTEIAQYVADYAIKRLAEIEDYFDYKLDKRLIFVIYNNQAEFKQSNIGLVTFTDDDYNLGGYSRLIKNKVSLYYEGDHIALQRQISSSIAEAIINEMINNADLKDRSNSSSSINMPDWYLKGLINYVAFRWDYNTENRVKDGFKSGKYKKISYLEYDDAIFAGQSFWRFIGKQYGDALIPNIIYLTKVYKNIDDGFQYVLGQKLKVLFKEWQEYYKNEFSTDKDFTGDGTILKKGRKDQIIQQVKISPDNKYIAYVTNDWGRKRIWLYNQQTGKTRIVFRMEPKYEHKTDNTYPVMAWHPSGKILTFVNEEKATLELYFYRVAERTPEKRRLLYFDKVLDFSYAPEGSRFVVSAVKDGITDIYIHTIASGTSEQITRDVADDLNPSFLKNSTEEIIFSSNRASDSLLNDADPFQKIAPTYDLFTYNILKRNNVLTRLTENKYNDMLRSSGSRDKALSFLSDNNGILNRYFAKLDSSISYVDTTTHYRYYINSRPLTNYDRNILEQDIPDGSDTYGEVIFDKGRYFVKKGTAVKSDENIGKDVVMTSFRKEQIRLLHKADSIEKLRQWLISEDKKRRDTLKKPLYEYYVKNEPIDINHYIFEKEKQNYYDQLWRKDYMNIDLDTGKLRLPLIRIYQTSFYNNYLSSQIDFSFLSNSYQAYNGGAPYFNPGVNLFERIGIIDLFENYKVTGGFRFSGNFDSNEYLLSVENLKGKFNKQLVYHRQSFTSQSDSGNLYKIHSDNVYFSLAKPLTPVLALKGTISYRIDKYVTLSSDPLTLSMKDINRHWASVKGEVIYDNTRKRSINIYYGTRFKIFGEYYKEITERKSDMVVLGIDFRHYLKIHRELIWANRFAASSSYGPTKLIYYLGGVDNWMGYFFNKIPMFDNSVPVNTRENYAFQAIATNMRGFSQNIRNGNNFALINSEIRWPFVRYFAGHPLRSNFLNSLQVVGFGDIGTAWSGKNPWSSENAYDTQTIKNGPIVVTLDSNREPIVAGFGAGLRFQLLGYFIRADWAWGIENHYVLPRVFYLSFSLDF
jgi:Tol biopolymer transport system component